MLILLQIAYKFQYVVSQLFHLSHYLLIIINRIFSNNNTTYIVFLSSLIIPYSFS